MLRVAEEQSEEKLRDSLSQLNQRLIELNGFAGEVASQIRHTQHDQRDVAKKLQALRAKRQKERDLDMGPGLRGGGWRT